MATTKEIIAAAIQASIDANAPSDGPKMALGSQSVAEAAFEDIYGSSPPVDFEDVWQWQDPEGTFLWISDGLAQVINSHAGTLVTSNDTTSGYLNGKLVGSSNIGLTVQNPGGDESLKVDLQNSIAVSGGVSCGTLRINSSGVALFGDASYGTLRILGDDATACWIQAGVTETSDSRKDIIFSSYLGVTQFLKIVGSTGNIDIPTGYILQDSWTVVSSPSFYNGWGTYGGSGGYGNVAYYRDKEGTVHVEGLLGHATGSYGISVYSFILPSGYRPRQRLMFPNFTQGGLGRFDVDVDGKVYMVSGSGTYASVNCKFRDASH